MTQQKSRTPTDKSRDGRRVCRPCAALIILSVLSLLPLRVSAQEGTPFTFAAIGDAGLPGPELLENAAALEDFAEQQPLSLLLFLGDNFYPIGLNINEPERSELIDDVLGPHRAVMSRLGRENVHAVAGNHDYYCREIGPAPMDRCFAGNVHEAEIPWWTYHFYYPTALRRPVAEGSRDSVEFLLIDSGFLLASDCGEWAPVLDSLERLLQRSADADGVSWRILITHHSPFTVGEHGGYRRWLKDAQTVGYIGNCRSEGDDPLKYVEEFFSNQDNCTDHYQLYNRTLDSIISRSGVRIQALIAGHDHSLQLLNRPDAMCDLCPDIFVVSGAGAKRSPVQSPRPPHSYTAPLNNNIERGNSRHGFVTGTFENGLLRLTFIGGDGDAVDMGDGVTTFLINREGTLVETR